MALYRYVGKDEHGKLQSGRVQAESPIEVVHHMNQKKIVVISVKELPEFLYKDITLFTPTVKFQDYVIYLRQFSTLLKAGISVVDATSALAEQTASKPLRTALQEIVEGLKQGFPFSTVAEKYTRIFPPLFINMIRAGEAGGNLDEILERLAIYYEKQHATRQKVKAALAYPIIVGIIAIGVVIFLLTTIVPTFAGMLLSMGATVPLATKIVLTASELLVSYWYAPLVIAIAGTGLLMFVKNHRRLKYYFDYVLLRVPIFGKLLQKSVLARMARSLSSLFASSVPIIQAVQIVEKIVANNVVERVLEDVRRSIEQGASMAVPMQRHWLFPPLITQMIAVGEKTGALDAMLEKVADFYEEEVDAASEQLKSLIEPLLIVFLSVIVGVIIAAVAIPMFSIFGEIGQ